MPRVVAFAGEKHSGKTTAADLLSGNLERPAKFAFADALKRSAQAMFGFTSAQLWGSLKDVIDPRYGKTPRDLVIWLGTQVRKNLGIEFPEGGCLWTQHFRTLVKTTDADIVVVEDCRFPDEVDAIREYGGKVIVIEPEEEKRNKGPPVHESEDVEAVKKAAGPDLMIIKNDKRSLEKLEQKVITTLLGCGFLRVESVTVA
jgi:hypothetical protein